MRNIYDIDGTVDNQSRALLCQSLGIRYAPLPPDFAPGIELSGWRDELTPEEREIWEDALGAERNIQTHRENLELENSQELEEIQDLQHTQDHDGHDVHDITIVIPQSLDERVQNALRSPAPETRRNLELLANLVTPFPDIDPRFAPAAHEISSPRSEGANSTPSSTGATVSSQTHSLLSSLPVSQRATWPDAPELAPRGPPVAYTFNTMADATAGGAQVADSSPSLQMSQIAPWPTRPTTPAIARHRFFNPRIAHPFITLMGTTAGAQQEANTLPPSQASQIVPWPRAPSIARHQVFSPAEPLPFITTTDTDTRARQLAEMAPEHLDLATASNFPSEPNARDLPSPRPSPEDS